MTKKRHSPGQALSTVSATRPVPGGRTARRSVPTSEVIGKGPHKGQALKQPRRSLGPHKGQAPKRPSGSGSGRSEHWNVNTLTSLAHSAKAPPFQSLLSERRPDTAEPTKNRSGAVSGQSEPWRRTPNPLAHSAKAPPFKSLLSERRPDTAKPRQLCESLAFTIFPELTLCALVPIVVFRNHS